MQRALMECVLEILLEVENLTSNERTRVQDSLSSIQSDITETSMQLKQMPVRYVGCLFLTAANLTIHSTRLMKATPYPSRETFSDISTLISVRYAHQSDEEANSVRIARARAGSSDSQGSEGDPEQGNQHHPHRPPADAPHDSQRRHLAKEINEIIKASAAVPIGKSTGLNRFARWNMEKLAAGSTLPVDGVVKVTGNTFNAQNTARDIAQVVSASLLQ